jgi:RHS repeat-associated protein
VAYTYDLADRLTSVVNGSTTDTYTYDGAGNRLTNVRGSVTTTYAWDVNASVALLATDSDSSARDYIYGNGLISEKVGAARYYYSSDAFGSVANETTSNGGLAWSYWYDPWGGTRSFSQGSSPPTNFMQFDGEYHDNTGAYNLRARIYQPGLGSFLQSDPAGVSSYAFASGRPTVMSDPSGMFPWAEVLFWTATAAIIVATIVTLQPELAGAWATLQFGEFSAASFYVAATNLAYGTAAAYAVGLATGSAAEEAATAASIDEAVSGLNAGRSAGVRVVNSAEELDDLFAQLSRGGEVVESSYPGKFVQLPDGTTVGLREASRTGGRAIDIVKPGQQPIKIHIGP